MSYKGAPGPRGFSNELDLVGYLVSELERKEGPKHQHHMGLDENPCIAVDAYVLMQALGALRNYEALMRKPLHELIAPYFFHS